MAATTAETAEQLNEMLLPSADFAVIKAESNYYIIITEVGSPSILLVELHLEL